MGTVFLVVIVVSAFALEAQAATKCVEDLKGKYMVDKKEVDTTVAKSTCENDVDWCAKITAPKLEIITPQIVGKERRDEVRDYEHRFCPSILSKMPKGDKLCKEIGKGCKEMEELSDSRTTLKAVGNTKLTVCCCTGDNCNGAVTFAALLTLPMLLLLAAVGRLV